MVKVCTVVVLDVRDVLRGHCRFCAFSTVVVRPLRRSLVSSVPSRTRCGDCQEMRGNASSHLCVTIAWSREVAQRQRPRVHRVRGQGRPVQRFPKAHRRRECFRTAYSASRLIMLSPPGRDTHHHSFPPRLSDARADRKGTIGLPRIPLTRTSSFANSVFNLMFI